MFSWSCQLFSNWEKVESLATVKETVGKNSSLVKDRVGKNSSLVKDRVGKFAVVKDRVGKFAVVKETVVILRKQLETNTVRD